MSVLDEVKDRVDIVDLISESLQLRKSGKNYTGFCPFHSNTRTPAFVVFPDTGTWRCFGQCNEGGDAISFVMKKEGWDFPEALQYLAERSGIEFKPPSAKEQAAEEENEGLRALLEEAVTFYRHNLLNAPAGENAREYLRQKRGLSDETIEVFGLGYAPDSWDAATQHFRSRGHPEEDLLACGLVSESEAGGIYDRFRNRVMFPIRDERGRMAGFGARVLNPDDVPKFLNSPQTGLFDKSRLLYGLDRARKTIRTQDQGVIVEGYLDVIALHQAGYTDAVSPMGTALTEHQLRLLKRYTRRIVLALDADAAGDKATLRGLQIARQTLDRESDPVFDARGLLGHEARLKADIRVTTLPEGLDPDDIVNQDPAEWQRILENAQPIVIHVMRTLAQGRDVEDAKTKSEIAAQVLPLIEDIPSPIERETYRQRLARLLQVDERALISEGGQRASGRRTSRRPGTQETAKLRESPAVRISDPLESRLVLEAHCLGVLLRRPDLVYRVDRALQERGLSRLSLDDFQSADHKTLLRLIESSLEQDHAEPLHFVLNSLSLPLMEAADRLLAGTEKLDPSEERVLADLVRTLLDLRRRNLHQHIDHLRFLMEEAQESGDMRAREYLQTMKHYIETRDRLDQALGRYTERAFVSTSLTRDNDW
jgi:DNA primase